MGSTRNDGDEKCDSVLNNVGCTEQTVEPVSKKPHIDYGQLVIKEYLLSDDEYAKRMYKLYNKALHCFWRPDEIDYSADRDSVFLKSSNSTVFRALTKFFLMADNIISDALEIRLQEFNKEITSLGIETKYFLSYQLAVEHIHVQTYQDQYRLFEDLTTPLLAWVTIPEQVDDFMNFVVAWIQEEDGSSEYSQFLHLLFVNMVIEGFVFVTLFAIAYESNSIKHFPGFMMGNNFILRDELLHLAAGQEMFVEIAKRDEAYAMDGEPAAIEELLIYFDAIIKLVCSEDSTANAKVFQDFGRYAIRQILEKVQIPVPKFLNVTRNPLSHDVNFYRPGDFVFLERPSTEYETYSQLTGSSEVDAHNTVCSSCTM